MENKTLGVIPARFGSTRLLGKPLLDICGLPMVCHVYNKAMLAGLGMVVVATDDERVLDECRKNNVSCMMTSSDHASGTDRVAEVAKSYPEYEYIVNIQGDEPLIDPLVITKVAEAVAEPGVDIATAKCMISREKAKDENTVKVVTDDNGKALYFSRSLLPFPRNDEAAQFWQHIGLYAYSREALINMSSMKPHPLEVSESLEQLRALASGMVIKLVETNEVAIGVDTPEDLENVRAIVARGGV